MTSSLFSINSCVIIRVLKKALLTGFFVLLCGSFAFADLRDIPFKEEYSSSHFSINFQPVYPLIIGQETQVRVATDLAANEVWLSLSNGEKIKLEEKGKKWVGKFVASKKPPYGWRLLSIHIKYKTEIENISAYNKFLQFFSIPSPSKKAEKLFVGKMWYRAFPIDTEIKEVLKSGAKKEDEVTVKDVMSVFGPEESVLSDTLSKKSQIEGQPTLFTLKEKESETLTQQGSSPLLISGDRVFSFSSKNIEGTKEGFLPGVSREESLRVSIAGKLQDTDIDATFFSSSVLGINEVSSREENVSILLKNGSTEAYLGNYTPKMDDLEFSSINNVLSGVRVEGEYDKWGFKMLAAAPKGESKFIKMYGNGTQGPYNLGFFPVVIDSERVEVNGISQKRGNDYDIDYQAGTITFKNKTIPKESIISIHYDFRETIYQHSTYALRGKLYPLPNLKIGATYINDLDSLNNAANIAQSASIEPQSHLIIGADGAFAYQDLINMQGEVAYSQKKNKLLSDPDLKDIGRAAKLDAVSAFGPFNLRGKFKRVGLNFAAVGDAKPRQDLTEYLTLLSFQPNSVLLAEGSFSNSDYLQEETRYKTVDKMGRVRLSQPAYPSFEYIYKEILESNDPVSGTPIDRLTIKDSLQIRHDMGIFQAAVTGDKEKRLSRTPTEEAIVYKTLNAGISLAPQEKFLASGNVELRETDGTFNDNDSYKKTYILKLSASPTREYMLAGSLNYIDDTKDGITQVSDFSYKAQLFGFLKTDGQYAVSSLKETFGVTEEGVRKEEGSLRFEINPFSNLRLRYYYRPNMTLLTRTQRPAYSNLTNQIESNWFIFNSTVLGYSLQTVNGFNIDKTDFPSYLRNQNVEDSTTAIYSIKTTPLNFLSCEFDYTKEDRVSLILTSTSEAAAYQKNNIQNRGLTAVIKTPLTEKFAIDSNYSYQISKTGTEESFDNAQNLLTQTISLKGILNINSFLALNASYSYSQLTNFLLADNRDTYTLAPGAGFTFSLPGQFRLDGNYSYAKSYVGTNSEKTNLSLRGKYDFYSFLHVAVRAESEISTFPSYKTSELSGNVEINL